MLFCDLPYSLTALHWEPTHIYESKSTLANKDFEGLLAKSSLDGQSFYEEKVFFAWGRAVATLDKTFQIARDIRMCDMNAESDPSGSTKPNSLSWSPEKLSAFFGDL